MRALLLSDGTLEFNYYDRRRTIHGGTIQQVFEVDKNGYSSASARSWDSIKLLVKKVYIDSSISGLGITNCSYWFNAFVNCTEVSGFENLSGMTNAAQMFSSCSSLETIYATSFNNTGLSGSLMFNGCTKLVGGTDGFVPNWLKDYKFRYWDRHSDTGIPVTDEEKRERAEEIATNLCDHGKWLTHGRSIRIGDLRDMRLQITDYTEDADLDDAITRYYTLLRMSFETNIYKIYETPTSQIYRSINNGQPQRTPHPLDLPNPLILDFECPKCQHTTKIQINFDEEFPVPTGLVGFPKDNIFRCPSCGSDSSLLGLRQQLEAQLHRTIV